MGQRKGETYAEYVKRITAPPPYYDGQLEEVYEWRQKLEHNRDLNRAKEKQGGFESAMLHYDFCGGDGETNTDLGRYVLTDCGRGAQIARRGYRSSQERFSTEQLAYRVAKYRQDVAKNIPASLPVFDQVILTNGNREEALSNLQELILRGEIKCTKSRVSKETRRRRKISASRRTSTTTIGTTCKKS